MCLIAVYFLASNMQISSEYEHTDKDIKKQFQILFFVMVGEHLFSYMCHYYRQYEIGDHG